jgi:PKD repeat protein
VKIVNVSEHASTYEWKFADGTSSNQISPVRNFSTDGRQPIALQVANEFGCTDGTVKQISINGDYNLGAQSTIRPGKDIFMPTSLKSSKSSFELAVYDGNGQRVYETSNRQKGWDGKLADGTNAPVGTVYTWRVILISESSKEQKYFNGTLTVSP